MDNDRKLLPQSGELLAAGLAAVRQSGAQFLLVPGDLTKDGERQDHQLMAGSLAELERSGTAVFVVPGNHDILNPHACRFTDTGKERVPWVTPEEFADIYRDFGYGEALDRDPASLSYVAELAPGLWLLALSSADYEENPKKDEPTTSGRLSRRTAAWIEDVLGRALSTGTAVIAMMHHGALEHYRGQARYFGEYLVRDYPQVSELLASYGVRLVCTGHYHAQDITLKRWDSGAFLYDIETGSLVSYPCPVRLVEIDGEQGMTVRTTRITTLPSFAQEGRDFEAYSLSFLRGGIAGIALKTMKGLGVPEGEAEKLAPQIAEAFVAHYAGDERFAGTEMLTLSGLSLMGSVVVGNRKDLVTGLWADLEPADNDVFINLADGSWSAR
jgi:3',5'-cyclic AMP phosphodiesterase CpdA